MRLNERRKIVLTQAFVGIISGLLLLIVSCRQCITNPDGEEPRDTSIELELGDVWTTSLTFRVSVVDTNTAWDFSLVRDDSTLMRHTVASRDTVVCDRGLQPGREYRYRAYRLIDDVIADSSAVVPAVTMNTTSHNFIWTIDTLGTYGSYLNDVWIVDENDIWVVGNIETDSGEYNAAHWDGNEWGLMQIHSAAPLYSIFYFSDNDIWVSSGFPKHWDGNDWTMYHLQNMGLDVSTEYMWGISSSNIYFVGLKGSIVHYDGTTFTKMASGTDVDLLSVSGTPDGEYLFAAGYDYHSPAPSVALEYSAGTWRTLYYHEGYWPDSDNFGATLAVAVYGDTAYFNMADGLWKYNYLTEESHYIESNICYFNRSGFKTIHINGLNDMFFGGAGMIYVHYNGCTWFYDSQFYDSYSQVALLGSDYLEDIVVMVGYCCSFGHGLVVRGRRN